MRRKGLFLFAFLVIFLIGFVVIVFLVKRLGRIRQIREIGQIKKDRVGEILEGLSLEQKVGQVVLTGLDGEAVGQAEKEMIKDANASGFVLLGKNIQNPDQVRNLTLEIQRIATTSATKDLPILISVDQEGGSVTRIDFPGFETTAQWQIESAEQAYEVGKKRGAELKSLGIDVNFSPVVEVLRNNNSYLGQTGRYFVGDEQKVVQLSRAMLEGMAESGVVGVIKHFPGGLGRTGLNPHDVLPKIEIDRSELEKDLLAFRRLIRDIRKIGGIGGIMVTHLLYPQIDEDNPAAISKIFTRDILRGELGFGGVVIVDDLNMGAVVKNYEPTEYGLKAILAGADLLIVIDKDMAIEVKERLKQAVEEGVFDEKVLNEAVGRVLRLRFKVKR